MSSRLVGRASRTLPCVAARTAPHILLLVAFAFALTSTFAPSTARAGEADVVEAEVHCSPAPGGRPASVCSFTVLVRHRDTGWDHYANRWDVVDPDGKIIASRQLRHPHVEEQPFRRSLGRVRIPHTTKSVTIRAHDSVHCDGGAVVVLAIPHELETKAREGAAPPPAP